MSPVEAQVSEAVEAARKALGLRPEAICVAAGFSRASYYSRIHTGGWRLAELERVAEPLGMSLQDLLTGGSSSACTGTSAGRHLYLVAA